MGQEEKSEENPETEEIEPFPFIKGKNIDLCPRNSKLLKQYVRWKNHPRVRKYARNVVPRTLEDQKQRFESKVEEFKDHISLDIWHKKDKKAIGNLGLNHIDWVSGWANAFLYIGEPEYWGQNIATEATELLVEYAFNELNLHKLQGGAAVENVGSWSVAEKVGFKFNGIRKDEMYVEGKYFSMKNYGILKEDWIKGQR